MFKIWLTNFGWYANDGNSVNSLETAKDICRRNGFDARIDRVGGYGMLGPVMTYSTIGGFNELPGLRKPAADPFYDDMIEMVEQTDAQQFEDLVARLAELAANVYNECQDPAWLSASLTLVEARTHVRRRSSN